MMFSLPIFLSISNDISLLLGAIAQTENYTASNSSMVGKRDTSKENYTSAVQILPSWNQGETRDRIISFVNNITDPNSPTYVPPIKE
jgi:hypothetical protein